MITIRPGRVKGDSARDRKRELIGLMRRWIEQELMLPKRDPHVMEKDGAAPALSDESSSLAALAIECASCAKCGLHEARTHAVPGAGSPTARLMIIGEAPGQEEDARGLPFVGPSGELLTKMLSAIGLDRDDVFITNVIKCRPPGNRNPEPSEIQSCLPYLKRQIALLRPEVILLLGKFAAVTLLGLDEDVSISKTRGRVYLYEGIRALPTFHPAYLLRAPSAKKDAWEDMKRLKEMMEEGAAPERSSA